MATTATSRDAQFYRTRKMATFLPVVGVPFLAVMFWVFGGGAGTGTAAAPAPAGINTDLPGAAERSITSSKLEAYAAPVDSLRNRELTAPGRLDTAGRRDLAFGMGAAGQSGTRADQAAATAQQQLAAVQAAQQGGGGAATAPAVTPEQQMQLMQAQHERELADARTQLQIAQLSAAANAGGGGGGGTVAAPAVAAVPKKKKPTTRALIVDEDAVVSSLGSGRSRPGQASFNGFDSESEAGVDANTLPAVIHESQEVVSGSLVKLRLTGPAVVNGHRLAANTFIYGKCSLAGERLNIAIETLKAGGSIFPAALEVYDVDGLEGLHIPGAITRDAGKQAGADALGAADMMTMSANPATAAAGVAVSAVKGLGQKKIRLVKVRLKAGYQVLLKVDKE